jgi:hypothetical protein
MHSTQIEPEQSVAQVRPVGDSVGYLDTEVRDFLSCPWCGGDLPPSKTKPRVYCSEAHEKRFKRAGCISKAASERLEQLAIDHWLAHFNTGRAFSTFGRHDPLSNLPSFSKRRKLDSGYRPCTAPKEEVVSNLGVNTPVPEPTPITFERHKVIPARKQTTNAYPAEEKLMRVMFGRKRGRV